MVSRGAMLRVLVMMMFCGNSCGSNSSCRIIDGARCGGFGFYPNQCISGKAVVCLFNDPNPYALQQCYCDIGHCSVKPENRSRPDDICQPSNEAVDRILPWVSNGSSVGNLSQKFAMAKNFSNDSNIVKELIFRALPECETRQYNLSIDTSFNAKLWRCRQAQQILEMCGIEMAVTYYTILDQDWMISFWFYSVVQYLLKMSARVGLMGIVSYLASAVLGEGAEKCFDAASDDEISTIQITVVEGVTGFVASQAEASLKKSAKQKGDNGQEAQVLPRQNTMNHGDTEVDISPENQVSRRPAGNHESSSSPGISNEMGEGGKGLQNDDSTLGDQNEQKAAVIGPMFSLLLGILYTTLLVASFTSLIISFYTSVLALWHFWANVDQWYDYVKASDFGPAHCSFAIHGQFIAYNKSAFYAAVSFSSLFDLVLWAGIILWGLLFSSFPYCCFTLCCWLKGCCSCCWCWLCNTCPTCLICIKWSVFSCCMACSSALMLVGYFLIFFYFFAGMLAWVICVGIVLGLLSACFLAILGVLLFVPHCLISLCRGCRDGISSPRKLLSAFLACMKKLVYEVLFPQYLQSDDKKQNQDMSSVPIGDFYFKVKPMCTMIKVQGVMYLIVVFLVFSALAATWGLSNSAISVFADSNVMGRFVSEPLPPPAELQGVDLSVSTAWTIQGIEWRGFAELFTGTFRTLFVDLPVSIVNHLSHATAPTIPFDVPMPSLNRLLSTISAAASVDFAAFFSWVIYANWINGLLEAFILALGVIMQKTNMS